LCERALLRHSVMLSALFSVMFSALFSVMFPVLHSVMFSVLLLVMMLPPPHLAVAGSGLGSNAEQELLHLREEG
jgi:hypothetical protein